MKVSAREHNRRLARARKRALEMEQPLADLIQPVLERAGAQAARAFREKATDFLTAAAFRRAAHARELTAAAPTSASTMIAVYPRPSEAQALAQPGGEEPGILHITLAFIGETTDDQLSVLLEAMRPVAAAFTPLEGVAGGIGSFGGEANADGSFRGPSIALPDVVGLVELRVAVTQAILAAGIGYSRDHGFCPHITLSYAEGGLETPPESVIGQPLHFDELVVTRGDIPTGIPFTGPTSLTAAVKTASGDETAQAILAVAEQHAPEGGYGDTAWNAGTRTVYWVGADWSTNDEIDAAEAAFLAVDGVDDFEYDAESCVPEGDGWEAIYCTSACGGCEALTAAGSKKKQGEQANPPQWASPAPDELLDLAALVAALKGKLDPIRLAAIEAIVADAVEGLGISFDVTNPFVEKVMSSTAAQVVDIAETTRADVMRIITAAYRDGLSIQDTAARITEFMAEASTARATAIARTELAGIVNGGSLAATQIVAEASGSAYKKQWLTAPGAPNPRHEDYEGLDRQTVGLNDYFDVGGAQLQFPADPDGPPDEVINCRCALVYVSGEGEPVSEGDVPDEG